MKRLVIGAIILAIASPAIAQRTTSVRGYFKKDGTYVAPHYRTAPNRSIYDNYSTRPNVNPFTGKIGTVDPNATPSYSTPRYSAPRSTYQQRTQPRSTFGVSDPYDFDGDSDD
jgi:hypothetical protein